jgi:hypothetical protein
MAEEKKNCYDKSCEMVNDSSVSGATPSTSVKPMEDSTLKSEGRHQAQIQACLIPVVGHKIVGGYKAADFRDR